MADQKPPRLSSEERATLLAALQYVRDSVVRKFDGLSDDDARRQLVASGTTLLWLLQHLAYAETIWIVERFAAERPDASESATIAEAIAAYRAVCARTDAIIAASELDDVCRNIDVEPNVNLRWVLTHLIEEIARHVGHADILRELIDGSTGR